MEVSGQRALTDRVVKLCSLCEDYAITTNADGFCVECEVNICNSCFVKHKGRRINRNHSLVTVNDSTSVNVTVGDTFEACQAHNGEFVNFFCPKHDQVGCGECSVLNHNGCKLEFIRDKVAALSTSNDSGKIIQEITRCKKEVEDSASLLVTNTQQLAGFYEQFVRDVEAFADYVIERIQIMKTSILNQAKEVMLNDKKKMDEFQNQTDDLIAELSRQNNLLETKNNQPNKLFVASLQVKTFLKKTKRNVDIVKKKNFVTQYKFKRDEKLAESVKEINVIGSLIEQSENIQQHHDQFRQTHAADNRQVQDLLSQVQDPLPQHAQSERRIKQNEKELAVTCKREDTMKPVAPQKLQPLLNRQLVCKNLNIDGECLSFTAYQSSGVGLYVFKENARDGTFIEIEILSMGKSGSLAIGLVSYGYPDNLLPGLGQTSYGYHSDGKVFRGSKIVNTPGDAWKVGERIKCEFRKYLAWFEWDVSFTHNGTNVGGSYVSLLLDFHFAVGMMSPGDRIKVVSFPAK